MEQFHFSFFQGRCRCRSRVCSLFRLIHSLYRSHFEKRSKNHILNIVIVHLDLNIFLSFLFIFLDLIFLLFCFCFCFSWMMKRHMTMVTWCHKPRFWEKSVIFQTLKHVWDMFDFNMTSNLCSYLALSVSKTLLVVWYFIMDLILSKVHSYFTLFESKSVVIFIFVYCLIISFKICKITRTLHRVFLFPNLNSYIVFY